MISPDVLVVGAGFSGAVIAHELAEAGHQVIVLDRRTHIGGNCYTERDEETGVNVHKYGPHILETSNKAVWDYLNRFAEIRPFTNRVKAVNHKGVFSFPINLHTLNQFFGQFMTPASAKAFIDSVRVDYGREPENFEEAALSKVGPELYETFLKHYTIKQWGRDPKEIPASVAARLPFRYNYDDNYYLSTYQGIPVNGYTEIFERLLKHENIRLCLGEAYKHSVFNYWYVFYTGPIDEFFGWKHGRLQYRTVEFKKATGNGDLQGNPVLNYTDDVSDFTRSHEHKHFAPWEQHDGSVLMFESAKETGVDDEPYYPVSTIRDKEVLKLYQQEAAELKGIEFLGRLGSYRYYSMCDTVGQALNVAHAWLRKQHG